MHGRGILCRLGKSAAGSTIAMMAAALIPMTILTGSAIDTARVYVVKTRLQQACDAGALAGRKFMTDLTSTALDATATAQAKNFFNNNFNPGWMSATEVNFTPTKTANNQVNGVATAKVPMTIMSMFGFGASKVTATCTARYDVADTDIIFVLDTTGSMACAPNDSDSTCSSYVSYAGTNSYTRPSGGGGVPGYAGTTGYSVPEKSNSRISALRAAVLNFYDTFAANADPSTHVRYGFVTYTSTVNAGQAIMDMSPTYMIGGAGNSTSSWNYQSRYVSGDYTISSNSVYRSGYNSSSCADAGSPRNPAPTQNNPYPYFSNGTASIVTTSWSNWYGCRFTTSTLGPRWTYKQIPLDVRQLVAGNTITDPSKVDSSTTSWLGCVEERDTTASSSFSQSSLPPDLDPDLTPNSDATRWRPLWPDVTYMRNNYGSTGTAYSNGDSNSHPNMGTSTYQRYGYTSCGKPVARLQVMTRTAVSNYVNARDFTPIGGTYHDTGMIWGTRLLSPDGIFKNDTSTWLGSSSAPNRVIIFLTDGDMAPSPYIYGQYGIEYYDQRVTGGNLSQQTNYHNARFLAECTAAKAKNIDVWTVTIGSSITSEMSSCATMPSQALNTTDGTDLSNKFAAIAKQLAMLRLTK
ncbi:hypothetical protein GRI58_06740 [Porphyrobacter algicida]|uniref:Putative Flp pilus-assembly TadG-like N-terminal domain-containing protein n=2 Tax=Qipengyuania algicida TaxID=1836209 RepID=A0A845AGC7_9SPHN|nr:hypothetical protein [Qipengyuania algicida]